MTNPFVPTSIVTGPTPPEREVARTRPIRAAGVPVAPLVTSGRVQWGKGERGDVMHQASPGVERAVAGARVWADRLGSEPVCLAHLVLALLDEDEGRPAVLLEHVGLAVPQVRDRLAGLESPPAPPIPALFNAARNWSLAHRHDPEFLTDAFLLAVLTADATFRATATALGLLPEVLERTLTKRSDILCRRTASYMSGTA